MEDVRVRPSWNRPGLALKRNDHADHDACIVAYRAEKSEPGQHLPIRP